MSIRKIVSFRKIVAPAALVLLLGGASIAVAQQGPAGQQGPWGQGNCYGMMGGYGMMGPMHGMMMGPGMMGWGTGQTAPANFNLSVADVKANLERWLSWQGNPRLKVGKVTEKDSNSIAAEIVTTDDSLVQRLEVDRHNGAMRQVQ